MQNLNKRFSVLVLKLGFLSEENLAIFKLIVSLYFKIKYNKIRGNYE